MNIDKKRNPYFDNARYVLILLVMFAHLFSPDRGVLTNNTFCIAFTFLINLFVMPAMFIISGYFSKKNINIRYIKSIIETLLIPLIVFELIFRIVVSDKLNPTDLFTEPFYILWFLGVLLSCKFLAPSLYRLNLYFVLCVTLLIGFSTHFEYKYLQWGGINLMKYLPYFIIGMIMQTNKINLSQFNFTKHHKLLSLIFFTLVFLGLYIAKPEFHEVLPEGDDEEKIMGIRLIVLKYGAIKSLTVDIIYRVLSVFLSFGFFILVPSKNTIYTYIGKYTIYAYLLHIFIVHFGIRKGLGIYDHQSSEWWYYVALVFSAFLMPPLLSSRIVRGLTKWVISPDLDKTFLGKIVFSQNKN